MRSYRHVISHKIVVTETLQLPVSTAGAKEALRPDPVRTFALSFTSLHLRRTHLQSYLNLLNSAHRFRRINSYLTFARTDCRPPTWSGRPSPWPLDAHLRGV